MARTISLNRTHGDPRHFRAKGQIALDESGHVTVTAKKTPGGAVTWFSFSAELVREMYNALGDPKDETTARA